MIDAPPATPPASNLTSKEDSIGSLGFSAYDDDILNTLLALDDDQTLVDCATADVPDSAVSLPTEPEQNLTLDADPKVVQKLRGALSNLPKNLQELFVERLVKVIASPETFQNQVEAVSALASAAAEEAKKRVESLGGDLDSCDEQSKELAAAVLGSYLARYGAALQSNDTNSSFDRDEVLMLS
jgi:hypothetical protein